MSFDRLIKNHPVVQVSYRSTTMELARMLRAIRPWTATWSFLRAIAIIALLSSSVAPSALAKSVLPDDINSSGYVLLIRHAYAPGNGDPDDFKLRNCSTQRNLNQQGREQALKIGEFLKAQNVIGPEVYSSQWCRCLETAKHMDIAPVIELSGLNSFYDYPEQRGGSSFQDTRISGGAAQQ